MRQNYLVQRVREAYQERPDLAGLLDDSVVASYGLTPPEVKALAACLLAGDNGVSAACAIAAREGLEAELFDTSLRSLQKRGLLRVDGGRLDFRGAEERLRVQTPEEVPSKEREAPECRVVLRPLRETVAAMATSEKTPAAGLGRVYSFIFGRQVERKEWGLLGKLANLLGPKEAALFLLEHAHRPFYDKNPLAELFPLAAARAKEWRPEGAPDPEEQAAERRQSDEASWRLRMRRWLDVGDLRANLKAIDERERAGLVWPEQAEADRRQVKLDFKRWEAAGRPELL